MPINGNQNLDKNDPDYGLPLDTCCVGDGGPSPTEVTTISKSAGRPAGLSGNFRIVGGSTTGWAGSAPKAVAQTGATPPVGYDGP